MPNLRDSKIIISPDSTMERKMLNSGLEGRLFLLGRINFTEDIYVVTGRPLVCPLHPELK